MSSGFSKQRLGRMHERMAGYVTRGELPGLITGIARRGEVHVDVLGKMATNGPAMERDSIFRLTSMTKPVLAVAALVLVEDCKLRLDEPVDGLLPELANRRVLKRIDGPLDETVPAKRPITLRDLLTFRMGFGILFTPTKGYPIFDAADALGLSTHAPKPRTEHNPDEWMRRFGTLPLMHQPGETWMYNTAFDVLGVLVARAAGKPLEAVLRERVFEPLGMKDTSFTVPADKRSRFVTCYQSGKDGGLAVHDGAEDSQWARPPAFPAGSDGLVGTVDDYLAFGQMLLDDGKAGNGRVLSRLSVEAMRTDQLTAAQKGDDPMWHDAGYGFGVAVVTQRSGISAVPGRIGWDGGYGTSWGTDPKERMVAILMTQRLAFPLTSGVYQDFWTSAYQAIDD